MKDVSHVMTKRYRAIHCLVCKYCGLMNLRNEATSRALRQPCDSRRTLTKEEEQD